MSQRTNNHLETDENLARLKSKYRLKGWIIGVVPQRNGTKEICLEAYMNKINNGMVRYRRFGLDGKDVGLFDPTVPNTSVISIPSAIRDGGRMIGRFKDMKEKNIWKWIERAGHPGTSTFDNGNVKEDVGESRTEVKTWLQTLQLVECSVPGYIWKGDLDNLGRSVDGALTLEQLLRRHAFDDMLLTRGNNTTVKLGWCKSHVDRTVHHDNRRKEIDAHPELYLRPADDKFVWIHPFRRGEERLFTIVGKTPAHPLYSFLRTDETFDQEYGIFCTNPLEGVANPVAKRRRGMTNARKEASLSSISTDDEEVTQSRSDTRPSFVPHSRDVSFKSHSSASTASIGLVRTTGRARTPQTRRFQNEQAVGERASKRPRLASSSGSLEIKVGQGGVDEASTGDVSDGDDDADKYVPRSNQLATPSTSSITCPDPAADRTLVTSHCSFARDVTATGSAAGIMDGRTSSLATMRLEELLAQKVLVELNMEIRRREKLLNSN